jgi:hypothetical protein
MVTPDTPATDLHWQKFASFSLFLNKRRTELHNRRNGDDVAASSSDRKHTRMNKNDVVQKGQAGERKRLRRHQLFSTY